jgi:ribosomal protein S12 methylthiotransferase accessory factor
MRAMMVHSGFGCHLSTAIALARALTEAIQVRTACVAGGRDTLTRQMFAALRNPRWQQRVSQAARAGRARRRFVRADHSGATFQEDIRRVCAQLRRIGVSQVLVADLARPEFGLPVVKVLVPGLHGTTRGARVRPFRPERA